MDEEATKASIMEDENEEETPNYIMPIFFTGKTQEIFECIGDQDVTEENPHKLISIEKIQQDFKDRAAISDFHPAKAIIQDYPADEVLVVYDPAFKYGQNFYLVTTEEAKELILNPPEDEISDEQKAAAEEVIEVRRGLRTPKPWLSLGSETEVLDEVIDDSRKKVKFSISRKLRVFGAPTYFDDRNDEQTKDWYVECAPYDDPSYSICKKELDIGIQHIPELQSVQSQTEWPCPTNANVQYYPRENTEEENQQIMEGEEMQDFIAEVLPRFELALEQNDSLNVFIDDYIELGEEDTTYGSKSDNYLKEYQSFTDLQFSKNKTISNIQWHPTIKGLIAVSCVEHMTFYDRVDQSSKCLMTPSLILIWSFADPIHPLLLLEAPDDILCFQINPSDPNIVCGGCINGQVVLWDISKYSDRLKNHRTPMQSGQTKQNMANMPSFMNTGTQELSPIIRYCAVSNIESGHRMPISDIQWLPDHMEIGRMGVVLENRMRTCSQLMTCSIDGSVLFWDTRPSKSAAPTGVSPSLNDGSTFKHLDLTWKPLLRATVQRMRGSAEYSALKFSIKEVQDMTKKSKVVEVPEEEKVSSHEMQFSGGGYGQKKDEGKQLDDISTKFYVATEDGELVYLDWKPTKDIDTGKIVSQKPEFCIEAHDGPMKSLEKSPFFKDVFLTVGGWTFAVWKEGVTFGPLVQSYAHECQLTAGFWSPTRPGVFFIGKSDGNVDVWDLLDKSHEPFLTQNVTPAAVIAVYPYQVSAKQQLLAVGDEVGTLHIMEVPWNLRHPAANEIGIVENYLERETKRLVYVENRQQMRAKEKSQIDAKSAIPVEPPRHEEDAEWEAKAKLEYMDYLELEKRILEGLGLREEDLGA